MPPPLSSADSAVNTSSTSGTREVLSTAMVSPSFSSPCGTSGRSSSTNFSPSRLVWRTRAVALRGSRTDFFTRSVTLALNVAGSSAILSTSPTDTSSTLTADCGTRSSTSSNSATTV